MYKLMEWEVAESFFLSSIRLPFEWRHEKLYTAEEGCVLSGSKSEGKRQKENHQKGRKEKRIPRR